MLTRTETYDGAHQLPEGQRWTLRLIFLTVSHTRKETYDGANQWPEGQSWTLRLIFPDGKLIKSCILAQKRKKKTEAHRVQKKMIMCSPQCQKKLFMCSYNSTPLGNGARS